MNAMGPSLTKDSKQQNQNADSSRPSPSWSLFPLTQFLTLNTGLGLPGFILFICEVRGLG